MTTTTAMRTTPAASAAGQRVAEQAAWLFYLVAAAGSSIGQIWVAVTIPPWPATIPWWARALLVLPFAVVIDLGGVVCAAFADARRRLGEAAYGWRILSAASVTLGVAINILGHAHIPYLAAVFGGLGVFAYSVWLLHSGARRRDALRTAGKLDDTAPVYGPAQWWREPTVTRRARTLALQHGLTIHASLLEARAQLAVERRTAALAKHVEKLVAARHDNPVLAAIAVTTLDIDAVAAALTARADVDGWARAIGVDLTPPTVDEPTSGPEPDIDLDNGQNVTAVPKDLLRRIPANQADYEQWRTIWQDWKQQPDDSHHLIADRHHISARQAQWIRSAGALGLLDSPQPPLNLLLRLLQTTNQHNGRVNGKVPLLP